MKRRIMAAVCLMAAAILMLSGCGADTKPAGSADGEAVQNGTEVGTDDGSVQDDTDVRSDGDTGADDGAVQDSMDAAPDNGTAQAAEERDSADDGAEIQMPAQQQISLSGRTLSILGDSISTFRGYNPEGHAVFFPDFGEVTAVEDTWWQRVVNELGLVLCQNSSSSGATVTGDSTGTSDPACSCNELRTGALAGYGGVCPDLIIVYLGANDMLKAVPLGTNDGMTLVEEGEITTFSDAYTLMLDKLQSKYPQAEIYCCTLLPIGDYGTETPFVEWVNGIGLTAADYSRVIVQIAENKGLSVIDLQDCGVSIDNLQEMTTEGVHPKPAGMACIAEAVREALEAR